LVLRGCRLLLAAAVAATAGCSQIAAQFPKTEPLERAIMLYEKGRLMEARRAAASMGGEGPAHDAAQELIADIDEIRARLIKRHMDLGKAYESAAMYERAQHEYNQAAQLNPDGTLILEEEPTAPAQPSEVTSASLFPQTAVLPPEDEIGEVKALATISFRKGKMYYESGKYAKALEKLTTALRLSPSFPEARELYKKALRERDEAVTLHLNEGLRRFQQEEMEQAIAAWRTVLDLDPENRVAADYLARATVMMKRLSEIREQQNGQAHLN